MIIHQLSIHHLRQDTIRKLIEEPRKLTNDQVCVSASGNTIVIQVQYGPLYPADYPDLLDVHEWAENHNCDYVELTESLPPDPGLKDYTREAEERVAAAAPELLAALKALFADYKRLADSGDVGHWLLEDEPVGQQALAAIARAEGTNAP